jgi:hypothetical protein
MSETTSAPSVEALEAEIAERRTHLSATIDELVTRVSPKELVRREVEDVQLRIAQFTRTPDGQVRTELVATALTAVAVVFIGVGLLRRNRS